MKQTKYAEDCCRTYAVILTKYSHREGPLSRTQVDIGLGLQRNGSGL